jgi:CBS domain-containing protein
MATIRAVLESKGSEIITVDGNVTLSEAIAMMASRDIGALVIQGDKYPDGIITERDVLRIWNERDRAEDTPVKEVMTRKLIVTKIDDTLMDALTVMIRKNIRHLLVMNGAQVAGLLSIKDLVKEQIKNNEAKISLLEDVLASETSDEL